MSGFVFGKTDILTFDMVHRGHYGILGYYYPTEFTNWWVDDWMTLLYAPRHV